MAVGRMRVAGDTTLPVYRGDRFIRSFQFTVDGILGTGVRKVYSRGTSFYNRDRWTMRMFIKHLCAWSSKLDNKGKTPTPDDIKGMIHKANTEVVNDPYIVIAATPNHLPTHLASALQGGACHEAWHTLYSQRKAITPNDVAFVRELWDRIPDWTRLGGALLEWSNIIDDIRIERCGTTQFPGSVGKMHDLQNYILDMEEEARAKRKALLEGIAEKVEQQTGKKPDLPSHRSSIEIIPAIFRDVGLGYNNARQRRAVDEYHAEDPLACKFVLEGPLSPLLAEAMELGPADKNEPYRLAMMVLITLYENQQPQEGGGEDDGEGDGEGEGAGGAGAPQGKPEQACCFNCGSKNLVLRKDPRLGKGQGLVVCLDCEAEQPANVSGGGGGQGGGQGASVRVENPDDWDLDGGGNGGGGEAAPPGGSGDGGAEDGTRGPVKGQGGRKGSKWLGSEENPPFWEVAQQYLDAAQQGSESGLLNNETALGGGVQRELDREEADVQTGEKVWRPADRTMDTIDFVKPSPVNPQTRRGGKADDTEKAREMVTAVRRGSSYLLSRLRNIVVAMEQTATYYGLRKGRGLSERHLVDTFVSLEAGDDPDQAYWDEDEQIDTSMAAVVVMDESGSMASHLQVATQAFITISEPLDKLGCPTMAIGFRDASTRWGGATSGPSDVTPHAHRNYAVHIDVFKLFGEKFGNVMWRFSRTTADGGTPMSDGIQIALEALSERPEAHRVVFVVTDGEPADTSVVRWQIRKARESGILIVGVGIGNGSKSVRKLFDDHVWVEEPHTLSHALAQKLNQLLDFRGLGRGRRYTGAG